MDIEMRIGREPEGTCVVTVPATCKKVSRRHATLYWHDGSITVEDNESSNGTFVNGKRIAKTKLKEGDTVWLGGKDGGDECYRLDLKEIFDSFRKAENENRTDYSKEFADIKRAYIDYQREVAALKSGVTKKAQMPRLLASLVPAVVGLFFVVFSKDMTLRIVSMSVGSVLSGVVGLLTMGKSSSVNEQMTEQVTELQIKYQPRYCCPKCGMKYPFTTHWKKLEADGKCPNPKCNAKFC